jgi:PAS domain S-box-containing protein
LHQLASQNRHGILWIAAGIAVALLLPICGSLVCKLLLIDFSFSHLPIHSLVESLGGLMALMIAAILIAERSRRDDADYFVWMASALIGMGVLDLYHAAVLPGAAFIWLHSCATFVGGVLFAAVWLPGGTKGRRLVNALPFVILAVTIVFGSIDCCSWWRIPAMQTADGEFTRLARCLNTGGGLGFLAAGVFFVRRFWQRGDSTDLLFAAHTVLLGSASISFHLSALWDAAWWWWHMLRLLAYLAALAFAVRAYRDAEHKVYSLNRELTALSQNLDRTVESRTAELRAIQERFALAVRGSTDGLWDWDLRTSEVYYAPRFKELLGYADDEFENVFASFETHLHSDDRAPTLTAVGRHVDDREPFSVECRLRTRNGAYRWFRARGQAVWDDAGRAVRMAGSITDITQRKHTEATLNRKAAELQRANQTLSVAEANARKAVVQRDRFLAMLSHELRNPLSAMLNGVALLERTDADGEAVAKARHAIRRQARQMSRLLDDLLDVARITQGKITFRKEVLDLNGVIVEAAQAIQPTIEARRQQLSVTPAPQPVMVEGDPTRLLQIVENLLTNASKYTPSEGTIALELKIRATDCELCVQDNGRGIDPKMLEEIFDLFFQSDNALDRRDGGMGVGLTLIRALVEMHDGTVVAHSAGLGRGSRFAVRLPLTSKLPVKSTETPVAQGDPATRVVLVEDNADSRDMLQTLLRLDGFQVEVAEDGQQGLEAILARRPDIALIDIGLPRLDGYEVARRVRKHFSGAEVHLVALTGYGQAKDRQAAYQAGFDEHLVKPVNLQELARVLRTPRKPR